MDPDDHLSHLETGYRLILRSSPSGAHNDKLNELIQKIKPETVVFVAVMVMFNNQLKKTWLLNITFFLTDTDTTVSGLMFWIN